jgi:hypothetical protein
MRAKANMSVQFEDEKKGEIVRNAKADVYLDCSDEVSMDYMKGIIAYAANCMADIVDDIGNEDDSGNIDFEGDGFNGH